MILAIIGAVSVLFGCSGEPPQEPVFYRITYTAGEGGSIEGQAVQEVESGSDAQPVTAKPQSGYSFVKWSDGLTAPERQEKAVCTDRFIKAIFSRYSGIPMPPETDPAPKKEYTVTYIAGEGGSIAGEAVQKVKENDSTQKVAAAADKNYRFVKWSDGIETDVRQELNVTSDITVTAEFEFVPTYCGLTYKVDGGKGGYIIGECRQEVEKGTDAQSVRAVANEGYVFSGWSDLSTDTVHQAKSMEKSWEYIAYFEPIKKTFRYDYGEGYGAPLKTDITLDRNALKEAQFTIPQRDGYIFRGWYADADYSLKVVHESGKLMLGYQTLNVQSDTLYARWGKEGEEKKTYKILMIMVDEIYASLYSTKAEKDILVDYKMTAIERQICSAIPPKLSYYLNKWFEGRVIFEFDIYFTREVIKKESFDWGMDSQHHRDYALQGDKIPEIDDIIDEYECTMVTCNLKDTSWLLRHGTGLATAKHAMILMDDSLNYYGIFDYPNQNLIEMINNYIDDGELNKYSRGLSFILSYIHEFIHTIEMRYYYSYLEEFKEYTEKLYKFHDWVGNKEHNQLENMRLYLLQQGVKDGNMIGIPLTYWEKFYNKEDTSMT